jgi:hypothetical protein
MRVWQNVVPTVMNRRVEVETLARGTTIIGRMLDTISAKQNLPIKASWITNAGRALWGVVEISVPRSAAKVLGDYWQSLLLLISVLLIVSGFISGQSSVVGVGWSLFAIFVLLFILRTSLSSYIRGGKALRSIAATIAVVLVCLTGIGAWKSYRWIDAFSSWLHVWISQHLKF